MSRPISPPDNTTSAWWEATKQSKLLVQKCDSCGHTQLYPRAVCTKCHSTDLSRLEASGTGTIYSFTEQHRAPSEAFFPPYVVALVKLTEGPVMMTSIVGDDLAEISCDASVKVAWEDLDDGRKLPVFELDEGK